MSRNPKQMTVEQQLLLAGQVIVATGWEPGCGGRGVCLLEALALVRGWPKSHWILIDPPRTLVEVCREASEELHGPKPFDLPWAVVTDWNDYDCDGVDSAVEVLERAAARSGRVDGCADLGR
jgi:hypothetical protein